MTPEQRAEVLRNYLPYLDNNYPAKGKRRDDAERAIMVGVMATAEAMGGRDAYIGMLLLGGRTLSKETK